MKIEYDPNKNQRNIEDRNLPFDRAAELDWDTALVWIDNRRDYGEVRYCALGYIGSRLHHITFTVREDITRVISLRKANKREVKKYAET